MRRVSYFSYLSLGAAVMALVSLPCSMTKMIKGGLLATCAPLVSALQRPPSASNEKIAKLEKENLALREQVATLQNLLASDEYIAKQVAYLGEIQSREGSEDFYRRRARTLAQRIHMHLQSLPAKVVFREPRHWGSALWIDVGEEDNEKIGLKIVAHNSPVVIGNALVGVVEHVEKKRSEVRLITDARLVPSVRAVRGEQNSKLLIGLIDQLGTILQKRSGYYSSQQEEKDVLASLAALRRNLSQGWGDYYLAKGELYGSSLPLWRSKKPRLCGVGFNYDTSDEEGRSRDLRTADLPLVQPGDLLITSGLDGIFPQGLEVAIVDKVHLLREGDSTYDLDALPIIPNLSELDRVTVLPPL